VRTHVPGSVLISFLFLAIAVFSGGCGNDIRTVNAITHTGSGPLMSARDIEVTFSDSGKIQARLTSPLLNRFSGTPPYTEFPKGFRVMIYDSANRVETTITGNWGKRFDDQKVMEARGDVIVRNERKNQQLNTEYLRWDERKQLISSNVNVKITTADKVLYGKGLEANESFTRYKIVNPSGQMMVQKDSL
jgi:LPS export ABC transporter protein LptC